MFKKFLVIFFLLLFPCFALADSLRMSGPTFDAYKWDLSEIHYWNTYSGGEECIMSTAKVFGYYKNGKYIDTSKFSHRNFSGYKYYVIAAPGVRCYKAYEHTLISVLKYDKENDRMIEYKPALRKSKQEIIAYYQHIKDGEFEKLDPQGNLISRFTKNNNILHYWYEYNPDGTLKTRHLSDFLPFAPHNY